MVGSYFAISENHLCKLFIIEGPEFDSGWWAYMETNRRHRPPHRCGKCYTIIVCEVKTKHVWRPTPTWFTTPLNPKSGNHLYWMRNNEQCTRDCRAVISSITVARELWTLSWIRIRDVTECSTYIKIMVNPWMLIQITLARTSVQRQLQHLSS